MKLIIKKEPSLFLNALELNEKPSLFDPQALKAMWNTLKLDPNPEMMANFEEVLSKLTGDVQKKTAEQETLENTMRHRTSQQQVSTNFVVILDFENLTFYLVLNLRLFRWFYVDLSSKLLARTFLLRLCQ